MADDEWSIVLLDMDSTITAAPVLRGMVLANCGAIRGCAARGSRCPTCSCAASGCPSGRPPGERPVCRYLDRFGEPNDGVTLLAPGGAVAGRAKRATFGHQETAAEG